MDKASCEIFILEINNFLCLDKHANFGCFSYLVYFFVLFAFWTTKSVSVASAYRELPTFLTHEDIYSSSKWARYFRSALHPDQFYRGPFSWLCGAACWRWNHSLLVNVSLWYNHFRHRNEMAWVTSGFTETAPGSASQIINPVTRKLTIFGCATESATFVSAAGLVFIIGRSRRNYKCPTATSTHVSYGNWGVLSTSSARLPIK